MEDWVIPDKELKLTSEEIAGLIDIEPHRGHKKKFSFCILKGCNMDCGFCIWKCYKKDTHIISPEKFEEAIIKLKKWNYNFCYLVGGEDCLHPKFKEIINILVKYKIKFTFVTNAKEWERYKFIFNDKKIKRWFDGCAVSLDGTESVHDQERGKGAYKRVLEFLDYCNKNKIIVSIKQAIGRHNYQDIMHVFRVAKEKNVDYEGFCICGENGYVLKASDLVEAKKIIEDNLTEIEKYNKKKSAKINIWFDDIRPLLFCHNLQERNLDIRPNGNVVLCCGHLDDRPIGNIFEDDISVILDVKCSLCLHLIGKVAPLLFNEIPFYVRDPCALCRYFLDCDDCRNKKDTPSN